MGSNGLKYEVVVLESKTKVVEMLLFFSVKDFGHLDFIYLGFMGILDSQAVCPELNLEEYIVN